MRLAASRCIAVESSRGWRITEERQSHKIDVIVALAMAAYAAVQGRNEYGYDATFRAFDPYYRDPDAPPPEPGWKVAGFGSRAEAEAYKARMRALYGDRFICLRISVAKQLECNRSLGPNLKSCALTREQQSGRFFFLAAGRNELIAKGAMNTGE